MADDARCGGAEADGGFEAVLREKAASVAGPLVQQLTQQLSSALVYSDATNVDTNRKLWDLYAQEWSEDADWVKRMMSHVAADGARPVHVGDEWSDTASLQAVLDDYALPLISEGAAVAEIGSGGGRVASRLAPRCASYTCFDISIEMLKRARAALAQAPQARFVHMKGPDVGDRWHGAFDLVVCFDVMVHMDLHTMYRYFRLIRAMLRPSGAAFVSTANLLAPLGWQRFAAQSKYTVGGFYFVSPDIVRKLVLESGLIIERESAPDGDNVYYNRDLVLVLRRAPAPQPAGACEDA